MKIAEVVSTFPPVLGGMENVSFHNALELARRGHKVTVFTIDYRRGPYHDPPDFDIVRLSSPLVHGAGGVFPQLYSKLKAFDIVHLHYPFFGGAEYVYLSSLFRKQKYFLTYHCDAYGDSLGRRLIISLYELVLRERILNRANRIGALTLAHLRSSRAGKFVDWNKVIELPNGVDTELFHPGGKDESLVHRYNLKGKFVVLFVGRLQECKGLHVLIDALSMIKDERVCLLVVGGGYSDKAYRRHVAERSLEGRVFFAGPKSPNEDLPRHYNLGDLFVLPSTYMESFGLAVLEAMASGIPAIVSSLPGPSQLVDEGRDGMIANVGDAQDLKTKIENLAKEDGKRRTMGLAAREKAVSKYGWNQIGARLEAVLKEIVEQ